MTPLLIVAVVAALLLLAGWLGYPLVLGLLVPRRSEAPPPAPAAPPPVTIVVATRDAPSIVAARLADLHATRYPPGALDIVVAVDVGSEHPIAAYRAASVERAVFVPGDPPGGKAATLNAAVRAARGELLVFADSQQSFEPGAIPALVDALADARFGAVSGALTLSGERSTRSVLSLFWRYELMLRRREAAVHSIVAVTGAIYAMRRALWRPLPAHLICDDLFVPLAVVMQGRRVGFCETARASDPRTFTRAQEFRRKVRTLTGMIQMCVWQPAILVPIRNPVWLQFVCHKLLRLATPYLALLVAVSVALLLLRDAPLLLFGLLGGGMLAAVLGWLLRPPLARRLASQVAWVAVLQAAPVRATLNALRGRWDVWKPS